MRGSALRVVLVLAVSWWPLVPAPSPPDFSFLRSAFQTSEKKPVTRDVYVGDETCRSCHRDKFESFTRTAHHLTSRQATADSIVGTFSSGANVLKTSNPGLSFRMDAKGGQFYETAVWGIPPSTTEETEPIDVVIGSGRKGQTYLYWKGDRLFQLPVSYWIEIGQWANSPGYTDGDASFDRPVMPRCLECHGSYAEYLPGSPMNNRYNRQSVVLGVSCERCHGPGSEHVSLHKSGTHTLDDGIINPTKLSRSRNIEVCAQCHAGMRFPTAPAFSYVPGQPLDEYFARDVSDPEVTIDVHGGQVALLQKSRCFQVSAAMTCSTCHDVHEPQRDAAAYSRHCAECHKPADCGAYRKAGAKIAAGCIDCHMPLQQSKAIVTASNGKQVRAKVRSHWIRVYPDERVSGSDEPGAVFRMGDRKVE